MREHVVQETVVEHAKAKGWLCRKVTYSGIRGAPDYWFFKDSRLILVEFKRPGRTPDGQQLKEHGRLKAAGFDVHIIDNIEAGRALFD